MYKIISMSKNYQGFLSHSAVAILGSLMLTTTPSLGVKTTMLEDIGFAAAHKAGIDGKGQHGIVSDGKMFLDHPAFNGADIQKIYESPRVVEEGHHGTIDLGVIVAQPSESPESYGAAYGAKVSVSNHKGSDNYGISNAFNDYKEQIRSWIKTDARIINVSYTPTFLIDLARDSEGQALLHDLLIKGDRLLVNSAGNWSIFHGVGNKGIDSGEKENGKKIFRNLPDLYINDAFQRFIDHVVFVGNMTYASDDEIKDDINTRNLAQLDINTKNSGSLLLAFKEMGINLPDLAKAIKEIESASKLRAPTQIKLQPLSEEQYVEEKYEAQKANFEAEVRQYFNKSKENLNTNVTYEKVLEDRIENLKYILKSFDYKDYLRDFPNMAKNEKVKEILLNQIGKVPLESWTQDYIQTLCQKGDLYSFVEETLEMLNPPPLYPSCKYRLHKTSNRAGLNTSHFICTLGTDIDSTAGGFSGEEATFKTMTGTSQAAPLVTSALLLGLQKYPGIEATALLKKLYDSADHLEGLEYWYGHGIMNVKRLLEIQ